MRANGRKKERRTREEKENKEKNAIGDHEGDALSRTCLFDKTNDGLVTLGNVRNG